MQVKQKNKQINNNIIQNSKQRDRKTVYWRVFLLCKLHSSFWRRISKQFLHIAIKN